MPGVEVSFGGPLKEPTTSPTRAELIEQLAREAQSRLVTSYLSHGHVYTEEPEQTIDILRDVLTRAAAPSPGDALRQQIEALDCYDVRGLDGEFIRRSDVLALLYRIEAGRICHGCARCEPQGECNDADGCDGSGFVGEPMPEDERAYLHGLIQAFDAATDPEEHPDLHARANAVLLPCDAAGRCVPAPPVAAAPAPPQTCATCRDNDPRDRLCRQGIIRTRVQSEWGCSLHEPAPAAGDTGEPT